MKFFLLVLVGACGFSPTLIHSGDDDVQADAQLGQVGPSDAPGTTIARPCHVTDPSVRLCLDFEDTALDPTVVDSSHGHDGAAIDVTPMTRSNQQAAAFDSSSSVVVAETPDLDIADNLTYEMWIDLHDPHTVTWPIDNYDQYALGIADNQMFCYANGEYADTTIDLGTAAWHHVACTYGGGKLMAYVDGAPVGCHTVSGPIPNNNTHGTNFGADFTGGLDDIHIYATALGSDAIAALAGVNPQPTPPLLCAAGDAGRRSPLL